MIKKIVISIAFSLLFVSGLSAAQGIKLDTQSDYNISVVPPKMSVAKKKQRFYNLVVLAIEKVYDDLDAEYRVIKKVVDAGKIDAKTKRYMQSYSAKNPQDLLMRMKPHAKSVAIAQAAMESAWATSRFTRIAKNLFGVWSLRKDEPRVAAGVKRGKKTIYVRKYSSVEASIRDYYRVLAINKVFEKFRVEKMRSNDPYKLVKKLDKYSEKGAAYGEELASMIKYNRFYEYD